MKNRRKAYWLVAIATIVMTVPAFSADPDEITVGDFLVGVASAKRFEARDGTAAEASLRAAGFDLPRLDRNKILTEGDVAAIANAIGLPIATSNPTNPFHSTRMDRFLTVMGPEIGKGTNGAGTRIGARESGADGVSASERSGSGSGKGKKKPKSKSPRKPKKPRKPRKPGRR